MSQEGDEPQITALFDAGDRALMSADIQALGAIVHGSEQDEVETGGNRFSVRYLYMDVVVTRSGKWQIVGSQLVRPVEE